MKRATVLVAMVFAVSAAWATTVVPMPIERLTARASDIVRARALESWSAWDAAHTRIYTYTRFSELKRMKGAASGTFVVKQMGGSAGGYTQHVAGVRYFRAGDEAVLFLRPSEAADHTFAVVGLMQGNFRVTRSASGQATASNGVPGVESFDGGAGTVRTYAGSRMALAELEASVRRAMR